MDGSRAKLEELERRLRAVEDRLGIGAPPAVGAEPPAAPADDGTSADGPGFVTRFLPSVSAVMASGAGFAFVLAAVYFLKLVYDSGWLTPERQLGLAVAGGVALILAGLQLARHDRPYAAYLPGAGVVILYLTVYVGHLYHGMIEPPAVVAGVGVVTLAAIGLHRFFDRTVYPLFAVIGAFSLPVLVPSRSPSAVDLMFYYGAWSLLFCFLSVQRRDRTVYVLAMWFALLGFDLSWRLSQASDLWVQAAGYQFFQLLLFAATAVGYSVIHRAPLRDLDAVIHGAALFAFYGIEYVVVRQNDPDLAPVVALCSVAVVLVLFLVARTALAGVAEPSAGAALASTYASVVTVHVVFFELLPSEYVAWGALVLPLMAIGLRSPLERVPGAMEPVRLVFGLVFLVGLLQLLAVSSGGPAVPLPWLALLLYAAVLYAGALHAHRRLGGHQSPPLLLYAGHAAVMVASVRGLDSSLAISAVWAALAIALLGLALALGDRVVGRSALLVFGAFGLKVLLYDLGGSPSLVRVGTLLLLGTSLYLGGWLYQRVLGADSVADG